MRADRTEGWAVTLRSSPQPVRGRGWDLPALHGTIGKVFSMWPFQRRKRPSHPAHRGHLLVAHSLVSALLPDGCPHFLTVLSYLHPQLQEPRHRGRRAAPGPGLCAEQVTKPECGSSTCLTGAPPGLLTPSSRTRLVGRIMAPKEVPTVITKACEYVVLHGKGGMKGTPQRGLMGDYLGLCRWPSVITRVLKNGRGGRSGSVRTAVKGERQRETVHTCTLAGFEGGRKATNQRTGVASKSGKGQENKFLPRAPKKDHRPATASF